MYVKSASFFLFHIFENFTLENKKNRVEEILCFVIWSKV